MEKDYIIEKEREFQNSIVKLFREQLHYEYLGKLQCNKGCNSMEDGSKNSPVIERELRRFLTRVGSTYTDSQVDEAVNKVMSMTCLVDNKKTTILETSNQFYELLINPLLIQPNQDAFHENVYLFDFNNPLQNNFAIAEEVSYTDPITGSNSRPDIVVYVNGIALAVIELKRSTVTIDEGIKQNLSNEIDLIPSFFTTTQFTIAANSEAFKYATLLTPQKFWCPWKRDNHKIGEPLKGEEAFTDFFKKETFFDLFRYGVVNDGGTKKVMRPHQYHALQAAMPRLKDKASGVIWHSQGSGKSLTMVWLAKYIRRTFGDARVLVITDRTELDTQINNKFLDAQESIYRAKSCNDLLDALQNGAEWLICSLIHKFGHLIDPQTQKEVEDEKRNRIALEKYLKELQELIDSKYEGGFKTKGTHKFVFVDECHRTQSGRLHEAMRSIMGDDVMFIGFTGTPLLASEKKTGGYRDYLKIKNASEHRFGPYIHQYLHKEAVDDKVILDLQYEARDVKQQIVSKEKLDKILEGILAGVTEDNKENIKARWTTMEKVYSSKERIERIGYSILEDLSQYPLKEDWCNAMLVAESIYSAYKYYEFFQHQCSDTSLRGKCAVVTSYTPSDNDKRKNNNGDDSAEQEAKFKNKMAGKSYEDLGVEDAGAYEAKAKRLFIEMPSQMKLLIVVDKLLTGFDAPSATYLYIDKDMSGHNLFQAICRVNRLGVDLKVDKNNPNSKTIFTHKEYGLIVDFKRLFDNIQDAVTNFNKEKGALGGYDSADIEGLLEDALTKNKKRLHSALEAYDALKSDWERSGVKNADEVVSYFVPESALASESEEYKAKRYAFYKIVSSLAGAYASISDYIIRAGFTEKEAETIRNKVSQASGLMLRVKQAATEDFDVKEKDPQMRQLLDRFIRAEDAETVIPATADFSFLDLLTQDSDTDQVAEKAKKEAGSAKAAAEKIKAKARAVINDWHAKDKTKSESFAERLQEILDQIKKNTEDTIEGVKKLIELLKVMKSKDSMPDGIKSAFARALYNNQDLWTSCKDEDCVLAGIKQLEYYMQNKAPADWKDTTSTHYLICLKGLSNLMNGAPVEQVLEVYKMAAANIE